MRQFRGNLSSLPFMVIALVLFLSRFVSVKTNTTHSTPHTKLYEFTPQP